MFTSDPKKDCKCQVISSGELLLEQLYRYELLLGNRDVTGVTSEQSAGNTMLHDDDSVYKVLMTHRLVKVYHEMYTLAFMQVSLLHGVLKTSRDR